MITPRIGDAIAELRDITKKMSLEDVIRRAKRMEKHRKHNPCISVKSV